MSGTKTEKKTVAQTQVEMLVLEQTCNVLREARKNLQVLTGILAYKQENEGHEEFVLGDTSTRRDIEAAIKASVGVILMGTARLP